MEASEPGCRETDEEGGPATQGQGPCGGRAAFREPRAALTLRQAECLALQSLSPENGSGLHTHSPGIYSVGGAVLSPLHVLPH